MYRIIQVIQVKDLHFINFIIKLPHVAAKKVNFDIYNPFTHI